MEEKLLRRMAENSNHRYRHGALVVKGGSVLGWGFNHHGKHAEMSALAALWPSKRRGVTLWVGRITKAGSWALSRPCEGCQRALRDDGIGKVMYSTSGGFKEMVI